MNRLKDYFVPLYVENDAAERILEDAGVAPYGVEEWQLVQTHLILDRGVVQELWRPSQDQKGSAPAELSAALDTAVLALGLKKGPPLPGYANPRLQETGSDGLLLRVILRFPIQANLPRQRTYTLDWIPLTGAQVRGLLPPSAAEGAASSGASATYAIDEALATDILIHFRPPLDTAQDPEDAARAQVTHAAMAGRPLGRRAGRAYIGLVGRMTQARPFWRGSIDVEGDHWSALYGADVAIQGYVAVDEATGRVVDGAFEITQASLIPPNKRPVVYEGMANAEGAGGI